MVPVSHCWTPSGDIYCGCEGGQLMRIDTETHGVKVLYSPPIPKQVFKSVSKELSSLEKEKTMSPVPDEDETEPSPSAKDQGNILKEGSINCLALHKHGLFAGGSDGYLRNLHVTKDVVQVADSWKSGSPISSLSWTTNFMRLAVGSTKGSMHMYDYSSPGVAELLSDTHFGNFVGIDFLAPGNQHCVSVRQDGKVQIWSLEEEKLVGSVYIGRPASCIAACPSSHCAAVGTLSGHVYMIDTTNMENPRIVHRLHIHQTPVLQMVYDTEGRFLITGSDDGNVFVADARPSAEFKVAAQTEVEGVVMGIATNTEQKHGPCKVIIIANNNNDVMSGANKCIQFDLPDDLIKALPSYLASKHCDLKDDVINKMSLNLSIPSYGVALKSDRVFYTMASDSKKLLQITLPEEPPKKANNKASYLQPDAEFPAHDLAGGTLTFSLHRQWLASAAPDGMLTLRELDDPEHPMNVPVHSCFMGGVFETRFSSDAQWMVTCGAGDGVIACYKWNFTSSGKNKATGAIEAARSNNAMLHGTRKSEDQILSGLPDWAEAASLPASRTVSKSFDGQQTALEKALEQDEIYMTPTPTLAGDPTWREVKEMEAVRAEDMEYSDVKKDLRNDIRELRRTIQNMMKNNETLPDIEKLGHDEFNLDSEEQQRLQLEGEQHVQQIREEMEMEDLAKMYLRELIKNECWDSMVVKGRSIKAFHNAVEVSNYPMRARSKEEQEELEFVTNVRQIEIAEMAARKEILDVQPKTNTKDKEKEKSGEGEGDDDESEEGDRQEQPATIGSLGAQYGGANPLFYSQFELHTRQQKRNQIVLLQDAIYRIKDTFNKAFDEVYKQREQEIARIGEKNQRITKILEDLMSTEGMWQPQMDSFEKPEKLLTVEEEEVTVDKFITEEQKAKIEEDAAKEAERKLKEKGDNARERALDMMMGGVLEIKKEDELKKDVPVPIFMSAKSQDEWTEDEKKVHAEYEKKCKELIEEREKYKKTLEAELKKIQTIIEDTTANFDDRLMNLFNKKIKTEMVVFQEELKILRLNHALLIDEELDAREEELNRQLNAKRALKHMCQQAVGQAKKMVDDYRDTYDIRVAEDKVMEKNFRKEFPDVNAAIVDQLARAYRRRPRGPRRPHVDTPIGGNNPFGERPLSARQPSNTAMLLKALEELDDVSHIPEGLIVDTSVWKRMCGVRREKVISEQEVKAQALTLADMNAFLQRRQMDDEQLKADMEDIMEELNQLRDTRLRFSCNLQVQFLLKQGQVEVDSGPFIPSYDDSILVHRSVVEDLNGTIRQLGEQKIAAMTESKDFRKGIHSLEWEHKKMVMQIEDLLNKAKNIQMLKVSRELQEFLHNEDHEGRRQQEIQILEQTLENQRGHHDKNIGERKKVLKKLRHTVRKKEKDNADLDNQLEEMNVCVAERKHINDVNAAMRNNTGAQKRMQDIVQRRKLVDLAKAQAQEVAVLRAEVERLRMRTFPALVQVER
ncbi:LOW QUALITY PROTEIN: cilia- and flagella-associated protein 43-like [Amphiura filiformis]|uniref:LOW QUALITY PROTEIN: cilia- and flagella-associated protein 43-like n=1 Tax=Amphiura filiformis TaxID=82378 RepID=UPI003B22158F